MFYKKNLFIGVLTFALFLMTIFTNAQQVIVKLYQPPPNEWNVADMWQLTLINNSQDSYNVYLYGTVEEAGAGVIFEGTSATFKVPLGFSGPVNRGDLEPVDVGYVNDDYEDIVQKTGTLPAGTYTICVHVRNFNGDDLGHDCKMQIIAHPSPPALISPVDEANVTEELPVFLWLPPMPGSEFISYSIKIVELLDGQTPIEAMEANPVWFEETEIQSTSFQFPISARKFEQGITFAWQVTAIAANKNWVIGNSEVWSLIYMGVEQPSDFLEGLLLAQKGWSRVRELTREMRQAVPCIKDLEKEAPWICLSPQPDWLPQVHVSYLVWEKSPSIEVVRIQSLDKRVMDMKIERQLMESSIECYGFSQRYRMVAKRDKQGELVEMTIESTKSKAVVQWIPSHGKEILLVINVDGIEFKKLWPGEPNAMCRLHKDLIAWLKEKGKHSGLIALKDAPFLTIGIGVISLVEKPNGGGYFADEKQWWQYVVADLLMGIPGTVGYAVL